MAAFEISAAGQPTNRDNARLDRGYERAIQLAECAVCFDPLCAKPCGGLYTRCNRACSHYFHMECASALEGNNCPVCRKEFEEARPMPHPINNPSEWFNAVDADSNGYLSFEEVLKGLETALPIDWNKISSEADNHWGEWDPDESGEISLDEFLNRSQGLITFLITHYPKKERSPPPNIKQNASAWFQYWDEDGNESLDRGEIVRALMKTFRLDGRRTDDVAQVVHALWPLFDLDLNGNISFPEFISADGLADSIVAQLDHDRIDNTDM
jgi:Ca2+-binding EF-hand superfamily protein